MFFAPSAMLLTVVKIPVDLLAGPCKLKYYTTHIFSKTITTQKA